MWECFVGPAVKFHDFSNWWFKLVLLLIKSFIQIWVYCPYLGVSYVVTTENHKVYWQNPNISLRPPSRSEWVRFLCVCVRVLFHRITQGHWFFNFFSHSLSWCSYYLLKSELLLRWYSGPNLTIQGKQFYFNWVTPNYSVCLLTITSF